VQKTTDLAARDSLLSLVGQHRHGGLDPTVSLSAAECWRAVRTPDGPGTVHLMQRNGVVEAEAFGSGADWLLARVPALLGANDNPAGLVAQHDVIADALHRHGAPRIGAGGVMFAPLVWAILGQRVTGQEAAQQWKALCRLTHEEAPGPRPLLLPPDPERMAKVPYYTLHKLGIDRGRAERIITVAKRAVRMEEALQMPLPEAYARLQAIPGIGHWTAAVALGPAAGDADAVAVGDFHLKNVVTYAFTGRARGTDDEMLELLSPYPGHRGRVIALLSKAGWAAPRFGPRQRIVSIAPF
jgi:3-methyladenine DNA glycosylase/8-oxoguanine DNA glycosylase